MVKSKQPRKKKASSEPIDVAKELAEALAEKPQVNRTHHTETPLPQVGDKVTFTESKVGMVYEISRVSNEGREVDLHLPGTNLERFRVNPEDLTFVERREPSGASRPTKPALNVAELTERITTVQHSSMDQFSGEIAVLKKYLKSKRVPEEAIEELDTFCDQQETAWKAVIAKVLKMLE